MIRSTSSVTEDSETLKRPKNWYNAISSENWERLISIRDREKDYYYMIITQSMTKNTAKPRILLWKHVNTEEKSRLQLLSTTR